ncbi:hypothetical protein [Pseudoxanthomonas wuyuanensis]|nr:hypothetical protein [Pseudoxanthomonas wuyuanensis]
MVTFGNIGWWIYLVFLLGCLLANAFGEPISIETGIGIAIGALAMLGLYGYLTKRKYGSRKLWVGCFYALLIGTVFYPSKVILSSLSEPKALVIFGGIGGILLMLPLIIAVFLYAFRSHDIWKG